MTQNAFAPPRANVEVRTGPEALWAMSYKEVRRLYLASSNIQALGGLYALGALLDLFLGYSYFTAPETYRRGPVNLVPFFMAFAVPSIVAAVTSFTRPGWARWLGVVLCLLSLVAIPLGTLIGIWGLFAYGRGARLFGPDRFRHREVVEVYKQRERDKR
ncbi:MAG TPA: hypothetical protein VLT89_06005 [Usitatibacter sp.]|nr:hypothetical protein [Usitatibacter sp.]